MSSAGTVLTAQPTREVARRAWPQWLALGVAMLAVAGVSVAWSDGGARLLLGALGLFLVVRGAVLLRTAPGLDGELAGRARTLGRVAALAGGAALVVALVSGVAAGRVLLVGVPVLLLGGALALLTRTRDRPPRRAGAARGGRARHRPPGGHRGRRELGPRGRRRHGAGRASPWPCWRCPCWSARSTCGRSPRSRHRRRRWRLRRLRLRGRRLRLLSTTATSCSTSARSAAPARTARPAGRRGAGRRAAGSRG